MFKTSLNTCVFVDSCRRTKLRITYGLDANTVVVTRLEVGQKVLPNRGLHDGVVLRAIFTDVLVLYLEVTLCALRVGGPGKT